jgi:hypothetical protein
MAELLAGRDAALPIVAVEAPCPRPRGERAPRLASSDKEERKAAIDATLAAIELAEKTGARTVVVRLGRTDIKDGWRETVRAFQRDTWTAKTADRQLVERRRLSARVLDQVRFALEPLLARSGVTVALVNRARWFEVPDEIETATLLEEFRGAPLATWFDPAAAHARATLGYGRQLPLASCVGAWRTDAAGLLGGLPYGRGEVGDGWLASLPKEAVQVVHAAPGASDDELRAAIE